MLQGHLTSRLVLAVMCAVPALAGLRSGTSASDTVAGSPAASPFAPHIVNGMTTSAYPSTGALLVYEDATRSTLAGICSGTLIGCRTFLTAAHCVCSEDADDSGTCDRLGKTPPAFIEVFLQHAGRFEAADVVIAPDFLFGERSDLAVVTLARPVTGVAPSAINTVRRPGAGMPGTIVGFGMTSAGRGASDDTGIKRAGTVSTGPCAPDINAGAHVCWTFTGVGSNTCLGDSGGPLFIDFGQGAMVAGVTSGGTSGNCLATDVAFDTDVFVNRDWIMAAAGGDLGGGSCDLPAAGGMLTATAATSGTLTVTRPQAMLPIQVPAGTALLRVALNGQMISASGPFLDDNDFDLFVRFEQTPGPAAFDCADAGPVSFGFCEIAAPQPGTWYALAQRTRGVGVVQVTATTFAGATRASCDGDCNEDGEVTVNELLVAVNIALGAGLDGCPSADANGDGSVSVNELIAAVGFALNGCPPA